MRGERQWSAPVRRALVVDYEAGVEWYAVRTNPQCEGRALATLGEKGFDAWLPMGRKVIVHHRSKKEIERTFPLLVGYIFLAMPADPTMRHWGVVRECQGVKAVLGVEGAPQALPFAEVDALRLAEVEERLRFASVRRRQAMGVEAFKAGEDVRIVVGPFSGFIGQVVDAASRRAIRLLISVFGGMNEVCVPVDAIEQVA
ncbi:transcription termination/antitermination protein NusG [Aureimonas mangrovi]|uniref:transcription termination/antitermination protein NusG n=1 Tax=Aureimonas mangrovi TaxID=2758041 RepID=UPI00163DC74A|nr:transcription termination/antitermination NusG family protein [Aureimonas mangrovi]